MRLRLFLLILACLAVPKATSSFMRGAAMAYLPVIDCNGTCSQYRANTSAKPQDALQILADSGVKQNETGATDASAQRRHAHRGTD